MDTQSAYEYMRLYLTRPGARPALGPNGDCLYETEIAGETHRCAVGAILSPSAITCLIQNRRLGGSIDSILETSDGTLDVVHRELAGVDEGFLQAAQDIHDEWDVGPFPVHHLDELAREHGLSVPEPAPETVVY